MLSGEHTRDCPNEGGYHLVYVAGLAQLDRVVAEHEFDVEQVSELALVVNVLFHSNLLIKFRRSLRSRLIVTVVIVQNSNN